MSCASGFFVSARLRHLPGGRRRCRAMAKMNGGGADFWPDWEAGNQCGRLVDENMSVLRRRICEARKRAAELRLDGDCEYELPASEWMKDDVRRQLLGLLQTFLLSTWPGVAVGLLLVLLMSLPTFAVAVADHLAAVCRTALSRIPIHKRSPTR